MRALSSTKLYFCWAGAALVVVALGCGDSTDSPTGTGATGGSGGSGASGGSGGSGGSSTGGTGGTGGSGGVGGALPDAGDVICGGMICPPTMFGMMTIPACCTAQNTCGISFGGTGMCFDPTTFDAGGGGRADTGTGVPDPNCSSLMLGGFTLGGCCMPDNTCGFSSQVGGCISLDALRALNIPGVNLPEGGPMACIYPPP